MLPKEKPRVALAPVLDKDSSVITTNEALVNQWLQLFAEELSNQVLPLAATQLKVCIADRRHATQAVDMQYAGDSML